MIAVVAICHFSGITVRIIQINQKLFFNRTEQSAAVIKPDKQSTDGTRIDSA